MRTQCGELRQQNHWNGHPDSNFQAWVNPSGSSPQDQSSARIESSDADSVYHTAPTFSSCQSVILLGSSERDSLFAAPLPISSTEVQSNLQFPLPAMTPESWTDQNLDNISAPAVDAAKSTAYDLLLMCSALRQNATSQHANTISYLRLLGVVGDSKGLRYATSNPRESHTMPPISHRPVLLPEGLFLTTTNPGLHGTFHAAASRVLPNLNNGSKDGRSIQDYELGLLVYEDAVLRHLDRAVRKEVQSQCPRITLEMLQDWTLGIRRVQGLIVKDMWKRSSPSLKFLAEYVKEVRHNLPNSVYVHCSWETPEENRRQLSTIVRSKLLGILSQPDCVQEALSEAQAAFSNADLCMPSMDPALMVQYNERTA